MIVAIRIHKHFCQCLWGHMRVSSCKYGMEEEHTNMHQHLQTFKTQEVVSNCSSDSYMDLLLDESRNIEDEDEYKISKYLLEKCICSNAVLDVVNEYHFVIAKIIHFLRKPVYPWETLYLHYRRSHLRHFDTTHSSPHEGTNHGLKSHSCAVKPTMNYKLRLWIHKQALEFTSVKKRFFRKPIEPTRNGLTFQHHLTQSLLQREYCNRWCLACSTIKHG